VIYMERAGTVLGSDYYPPADSITVAESTLGQCLLDLCGDSNPLAFGLT